MKKIVVTAMTRAKENKVTRIDEGTFQVAVTAAPHGGRANKAIIGLLAEYFKVAPSRIRIVMGKTHKEKLVEIN